MSQKVKGVDVDQVVAALTEELDLMTERVVENRYHGLLRARDEGRASALALAVHLLTGEPIGDVQQAAETRALEKQMRSEDARVLVKLPGGRMGWMKPWCDCSPRGPFTRNQQGVWVRRCCGRKEKYAWLKHGYTLGRTLPLSGGKGR